MQILTSEFRNSIASASHKELLILLLKGIGLGALLLATLMAPNMAKAFAELGIIDDPKRRKEITRRLKTMEKRGLIVHRSGQYVLADKGTRILEKDALWSYQPKLTRPRGQVRYLCMFDIPAKKERGRQAFRIRLRELGFKKYQHSVFIHHENHQQFLVKFAAFYGIREHVRFLKVISTF